MTQIQIETPTGSQAKVDAHDVDGSAHPDIRALVAGAGTPDATGSVKGKVQLAGDLGGTATSPTVPGLAGKANTSHTHVEADVTGLVSDLAGKASAVHTHAESDVTGLVSDLAAKAADSAVVHNTGAEVVAGVKTFSSAPVVPSASFPESAVTNLVTDLAGKQPIDSDLTTIAALTATTDNVIQSVAGSWASRTMAQLKTALGLVKADVGLGNVDNTSDATKNSASATLTNKTLTSPVINTPTGITPSDVGAQPVDSDLTTIAGLTATTDSFLQAKASAWTTRTIAQVKTDLAVPTVPSDIGAQPLDSDLTTIAGLTATTDNFMVAASSAWASRTPTQAKASLAMTEADVSGLTADLAARVLKLIPTVPKTANYTAVAGDFVPCDTATTGAFTVTLPNAPADGAQVAIEHVIQGVGNLVTYACAGSDVFDKTGGTTSRTLDVVGHAVVLQYKASLGVWYRASGFLPLGQLDARYQVTSPLATGQEVLARDMATSNAATTSASGLRLSFFTSRKSEVSTQVRVLTGSTAAGATPTLCRIGLYSIDASDNGTLVASIANDTTLFAAINTAYVRSWSSPYSVVAGQRYALGILIVTAAALPTFNGLIFQTAFLAEMAIPPRVSGNLASQSDLPSSFTVGSLSNSGVRHYGVVLP